MSARLVACLTALLMATASSAARQGLNGTLLVANRLYPTGGREAHMVRLSPDGRRAFVTSRGDSDLFFIS
jgi:hypothetical protein